MDMIYLMVVNDVDMIKSKIYIMSDLIYKSRFICSFFTLRKYVTLVFYILNI
jgi:hypothetical protein